jgi:prolyl-tRNA synthetase
MLQLLFSRTKCITRSSFIAKTTRIRTTRTIINSTSQQQRHNHNHHHDAEEDNIASNTLELASNHYEMNLYSHNFIPMNTFGFDKTLPVPEHRTLANMIEVTFAYKLLVHCGFIDSRSIGMYNWLPLGERVMRKLVNMIESAVESRGNPYFKLNAQRISISSLVPRRYFTGEAITGNSGKRKILKDYYETELYLATDQSDQIVAELFTASSRPKQRLPLRLYTVNHKFRSEQYDSINIMTSKQYLSHDLYSFDEKSSLAMQSRDLMRNIYKDILNRLGLTVLVTEDRTSEITNRLQMNIASPHALSKNILCCSCDKKFNSTVEDTASYLSAQHLEDVEKSNCPLVRIDKVTESIVTREYLLSLLSNPKVIFYRVDMESDTSQPIVLIMPRKIRPQIEKVNRKMNITSTRMNLCKADDLNKPDLVVLIDNSLLSICEDICRNEENATQQPSYEVCKLYASDFRLAKSGDLCARSDCIHGPLKLTNVVEVASINYFDPSYFQSQLQVSHVDGELERRSHVTNATMDLYSIIGIIAERENDIHGIVWPFHIAPFRAFIIGHSSRERVDSSVSQTLYDEAVTLYQQLNQITDFTNEVLFYDIVDKWDSVEEAENFAMTVGIPYIIVLDHDYIETRKYKLIERRTLVSNMMALDEILHYLKTTPKQ